MRLFLALELPDAVRQHLIALRDAWRERQRHHLKWVDPTNLHVTLKFLGDVAEGDVRHLSDALREQPPVNSILLRTGGMAFFPERGPIRVVAAALEGETERLAELHRRVESACETRGFPRERRAYRPHVTLGRSRDGLPAKLRGGHASDAADALPDASQASFAAPAFTVGEYVLMESRLHPTGPEYRVIESFALNPSER